MRLRGESSSESEEEDEVAEGKDWYRKMQLPPQLHSFQDAPYKEALVPVAPGLAQRMLERDTKRLKSNAKPVTVFNRKARSQSKNAQVNFDGNPATPCLVFNREVPGSSNLERVAMVGLREHDLVFLTVF